MVQRVIPFMATYMTHLRGSVCSSTPLHHYEEGDSVHCTDAHSHVGKVGAYISIITTLSM